MSRVAIITGVTGQDGIYMAELLLKKGYKVIGTSRSISGALKSIPHELTHNIKLYEWDAIDYLQLCNIIDIAKPNEIYNFAALSSGEKMYEDPATIGLVNGLAVTKILCAINEINPKIRLCQASSSEMFGRESSYPQSEETAFNPSNPYAAAKLYSHQMVDIYRKRYGLFACSAILFNHESPRRGINFVTRKITHTAAQIKLGIAQELVLGNLESERDWMFAGDAVQAMWMMIQAAEASDFIVAGGIGRSIREFCRTAFEYLNLNYLEHVRSSPEFFRPIDSSSLVGNIKKLERLGWSPSLSFKQLVHKMVDHDLLLLRNKM